MNAEQIEKAQKYLRVNVNWMLEKLTEDLLDQKPDNLVDYMISWLDKKGKDLQVENKRKQLNRPEAVDTSESEEFNDDEDDPEVDPGIGRLSGAGRRSVSAEVYGQFNKMAEFKPKVIQKPAETMIRIKELLAANFLFTHVDKKDVEIIVNALEVKNFAAGEKVIDQGADGFELFVVNSGKLRCTRRPSPNEPESFIREYGAGDLFGELALMYNAPRAATIVSVTNSELFSLDRETFNQIVKTATMKARDKFDAFISEVPILETLQPYERSKICDIMKVQIFSADQRVIRESERGDTFYIILEGKAKALKTNPQTNQEEEVMSYSERMYFGELALLKDEPRAASIVATVR